MIYFLIALGFLSRFLLLENFHFPTWDGTFYINYFVDSSWQWVLHPGYPIAIQLIPIGDKVFAAQLISTIAGSLSVLPLYRISRKYASELESLIIGIFFLFCPLIFHYSLLTYSESLYLLTLLWALERYISKGYRVSGILFGLSYLIRPEALVVILALIVYDLIRYRKWLVLRTLLFCGLISLPYIGYISNESGNLTLTKKTMNIRNWSEDWKTNISQEGLNKDYSLSSTIENYPQKEFKFVFDLFYSSTPILLIFAIGAIIIIPNSMASGLVLFPLLGLLGIGTDDRFLVPFIPFIIFFGVLGIKHWVAKKFHVFAYSICGLFFIFQTSSVISRPIEQFPEMEKIGRVMPPGKIFFDRKPYAAFFAKGIYKTIPNGPIDSAIIEMKKNGDFLVLSLKVIPVFRPNFNPLFDSRNSVQYGISPYIWNSNDGIILYKLR